MAELSDDGYIYTCITKDGTRHDIEALTAHHANSIAEKRYGYANIAVAPQESLRKPAKDAVAPIPLGRAKDIANDPRTQLDSRRAELREARRKIAEYSGKPGVTARFDRQINELTREVEKLEKKVAALPPDKPLSERIKGNDVLRDFARKVLAR